MMRVSNLKGGKVKVRSVNPSELTALQRRRAEDASRRAEATSTGGSRLIAAARCTRPEFEIKARWYVARCRAGQEARIAEELTLEGVEVWAPMKEVRRKKRFGEGVVVYSVPVFHSYVFVRLYPDAEAWVGALMASRLLCFVGKDGVPVPIATTMINALKLNAFKRPKKDEDLPFKVAESVRVKDGPFAGFVATVKALMGKHWRADVEVDIFGRMTHVELEIDQLERL